MSNPQGNGAPEAPQGTGAPEALTADAVNEMVNRAITARLQDYGKRQEKHFSTLMDTFTSKLDEKFGAPKAPDGQQAPTIQEHPEFKGMLKRQQEMEQKLRAAEERAAFEQSKAQDTALRQRMSDELTKLGVDPKYVRHATGLLVDAEKRVRWSEEGDKLVWRDQDGADNDFATAIKGWAKSDDAKPYLPPRGVNGSGGVPSNGQPNKTNGDMSQDAATLLMKHLTGG